MLEIARGPQPSGHTAVSKCQESKQSFACHSPSLTLPVPGDKNIGDPCFKQYKAGCNSFYLIIKETCSLVLSWWKIMSFMLINSRHSLLSAAFSWSNWEQYFSESGFPEGAHNRGFPSNPTLYTTSPSLDKDWPLLWLVVVHFACPTIRTSALISHISKVMLKILQARLQQYVNWKIPGKQARFRKSRGTRDQTASIC